MPLLLGQRALLVFCVPNEARNSSVSEHDISHQKKAALSNEEHHLSKEKTTLSHEEHFLSNAKPLLSKQNLILSNEERSLSKQDSILSNEPPPSSPQQSQAHQKARRKPPMGDFLLAFKRSFDIFREVTGTSRIFFSSRFFFFFGFFFHDFPSSSSRLPSTPHAHFLLKVAWDGFVPGS
ncbi:hypothetical protein JNUCC1_01044 [Lentibacillus sp. JNUCC-1]|nr:hypothetical protein [Lentibacillus sp. JNUCC-1]